MERRSLFKSRAGNLEAPLNDYVQDHRPVLEAVRGFRTPSANCSASIPPIHPPSPQSHPPSNPPSKLQELIERAANRRQQVILAPMAYGALRRSEVVSLDVGDFVAEFGLRRVKGKAARKRRCRCRKRPAGSSRNICHTTGAAPSPATRCSSSAIARAVGNAAKGACPITASER